MSRTILNFAYGSNMLLARMRARVPSAHCRGVAVLPGHEMRWHKLGMDGSGKCDVVTSDVAGALVHGVLYEVPLDEKAALDRAEGLGDGYDEHHVDVIAGGQTLRAMLYKATRTDAALLPFTWYRSLVVAGARQHAFPAQYAAALEAVPAQQDPDGERHRLNVLLSRNGS